MERRGIFDRIQCKEGVVLAVLSIEHIYGRPQIQTIAGYAPARSKTYPSYYIHNFYMKLYFTIWGKGDIIVFCSLFLLIKAVQRHQPGNVVMDEGAVSFNN